MGLRRGLLRLFLRLAATRAGGWFFTTVTPPPKIKGWLREEVGSLEDWAAAAQASLHTEAAKLRKVTITVQQDSGLAHMARSYDSLLVYVPLWRQNLWRRRTGGTGWPSSSTTT